MTFAQSALLSLGGEYGGIGSDTHLDVAGCAAKAYRSRHFAAAAWTDREPFRHNRPQWFSADPEGSKT